MRLLSALFFICRKTTVIESARLSGAQPVRRTVLGGLGDAHQQAESFLYKRTLLASIIPSSREQLINIALKQSDV